MFNNEILQKLLISYLYGNDILHFPQELKLIAESTSRLSKLFTRDRANLPSDYLKDRNLRNAYILYFLQANLYKIHIPLRELSMHPAKLFLKDRLRILDIGSGPGTAILGILEFFAGRDQKPFLEFVAVDSVAENLRDAEGLFRLFMDVQKQKQEVRSKMQEVRCKKLEINITTENPPPFSRGGMGGCFSDECSLTTIKSSIEKIKKLPSFPFDIIVLSNLLSEVGHNEPERIGRRVKLLKKLLNDFMSDNGSCIIIEPALRETSREMLEVRDGMSEEGFHIYSPCLMDKQCPALDNPKDWCHEDIPWNPPELIKKIDNLTGLRKDSIKFSYLVIRKDMLSISKVLTKWYEKTPPPHPPLIKGGKVSEVHKGQQHSPPLFKGGRGGVYSSEDSYRIVSEPLISKGKIEFYICSSSGRNLVVRLDKDRSPLNKAFEELKRGDVVQLAGVQNNGRRLQIGKESIVKLVQTI